MAKPVLLLGSEFADDLLGDALADRFEALCPWRAADPDGLLRARGAEVVAALTWHLDAALLAKLPNLTFVAVPGAGYDGIDVAAARARGIVIANAGATHSGDVADHAVAMTIASLHLLPEMQAFARDGRWANGPPVFRRRALSTERFGIVGMGNIGAAIAERLAPFRGAIAWWGPRAKPATWPRIETLRELADWCSTLILAARGDAGRLIDADVIEGVGPKGLIVNISRGSLIDEDALIGALKSGRLGRAALDVFAQEPTPPDRWRDVPNVLLTPHVAGASDESFRNLRKAAIRNLSHVLDGGPLVNRILD